MGIIVATLSLVFWAALYGLLKEYPSIPNFILLALGSSWLLFFFWLHQTEKIIESLKDTIDNCLETIEILQTKIDNSEDDFE